MENNNIMDDIISIPTVQEVVMEDTNSTVQPTSQSDLQNFVSTASIQSPRDMNIGRPIKRTNTIIREYRIGRNDKCPCGSGKKYKNCCLENQKYEDRYELTNREMNQLRESRMNIDTIRKNVVNR